MEFIVPLLFLFNLLSTHFLAYIALSKFKKFSKKLTKQYYYYIFAPYHDPTRPHFVPQEALNLNDDFLIRTHVLTRLQFFFKILKKSQNAS